MESVNGLSSAACRRFRLLLYRVDGQYRTVLRGIAVFSFLSSSFVIILLVVPLFPRHFVCAFVFVAPGAGLPSHRHKLLQRILTISTESVGLLRLTYQPMLPAWNVPSTCLPLEQELVERRRLLLLAPASPRRSGSAPPGFVQFA